MSAHKLIHKYIKETYIKIDYPILIVNNYYILDKGKNHYSAVFSVTANDCLYIETGKKFHFTLKLQFKDNTVVETGIECTELTPFELQEITSH